MPLACLSRPAPPASATPATCHTLLPLLQLLLPAATAPKLPWDQVLPKLNVKLTEEHKRIISEQRTKEGSSSSSSSSNQDIRTGKSKCGSAWECMVQEVATDHLPPYPWPASKLCMLGIEFGQWTQQPQPRKRALQRDNR
eukprot:89159-Pelagomonas_calceolata.AAC.1